jgi:hypothetical protein
MATNEPRNRVSSSHWPDTRPPMSRGEDGGWTIELAAPNDGRLSVVYERAGGIIRITGDALVRHPQGDIRQPVTIVIRQEDAKDLGPAIMGRLNAIG